MPTEISKNEAAFKDTASCPSTYCKPYTAPWSGLNNGSAVCQQLCKNAGRQRYKHSVWGNVAVLNSGNRTMREKQVLFSTLSSLPLRHRFFETRLLCIPAILFQQDSLVAKCCSPCCRQKRTALGTIKMSSIARDLEAEFRLETEDLHEYTPR